MALKFRRRVTVFPGVRLNLSKSGISTTIGPRGANVNFNRHGAFLNTGLPGTGIYDRQRIGGGRRKASRSRAGYNDDFFEAPEFIVPPSVALEGATCEGLRDLHDALKACVSERKKLRSEIAAAEKAAKRAADLLLISRILIVGFVFKYFGRNRDEKEAILAEREAALEICTVDVDIDADASTTEAYTLLKNAFEALATCDMVWDISSKIPRRAVKQRSHQGAEHYRIPVACNMTSIEALRSEFEGMHLENATGADLYFYPGFLVLVGRKGAFALTDHREIRMTFGTEDFPETETVPDDAEIIGSTWYRANKDGSPDLRFRDNYEIPLCRYGVIRIEGPAGHDEKFAFSNAEKAADFARAFGAYKSLISG